MMSPPGRIWLLGILELGALSSCAVDPGGCLQADPAGVFRDACSEPFVLPGHAGAPRALLFGAFPYDLAHGDLLRKASELLAAGGSRNEWVGAGSPAYGLAQAEAELPRLLERFHPRLVVVLFTQTQALDEQLYAESRRWPAVVRTAMYEFTKAQAFGGARPTDPRLGGAVMGDLLARLKRLQKIAADRDARLVLLADGQAKQLPGDPRTIAFFSPLSAFTHALWRPRALRSMEFLPIFAQKEGLDLHVSYALGMALSAANTNTTLAATLIAAELGTAMRAQEGDGGT